MRVLVTGGTGYIGRSAIAALIRAGHEVRALVRDGERAATGFGASGAPIPDLVVGNALDRETVQRALANCDALLHAAAIYSYERRDAKRVLVETPALARAVLGAALNVGTPRVVDISSTAVFSLDVARVDESTPLTRAGRPEWADPYVQAKVMAERSGRELEMKGLPRVTLHPSLVIGPDDAGPGVSGALIIRLLKGTMFLRARLGWVDVREVAAATVAALEARPGSNYIVSGPVQSLAEVARRLDALTGRRRRRAFPRAGLLTGIAALNDRLGAPLREMPPPRNVQVMVHFPPAIDGSRAERDLGIRYRPLDETLADAIRWWVARGMLDRRTAGRLAADVTAAAGAG